MWGFFQNRGYYQYTNGYTTEFGFNDGSGSGFASMLLSLPAVKQRQAGIPQMNLRNWGSDAFVEDSWQVTPTTTLNLGVRYEYSNPLYDKDNTNTNLIFQNGVPSVFVGGQNGYPARADVCEQAQLCARVSESPRTFPIAASCFMRRTASSSRPWTRTPGATSGTTCRIVFPETQQADNFTPPAALFTTGLNFGTPVLGTGTLPATTVSFTAFDPHAPAQYVQQWNGSVQKSLGKDTSVEIGYLGSRGFHLQRAHLINNTLPGPGPLGPAPSVQDAYLCSRTPRCRRAAPTPSSRARLFRSAPSTCSKTRAQSWYDAGYVNVRRRYSHGLSFLANYTLRQEPDQRAGLSLAHGRSVHSAKQPGPRTPKKVRAVTCAIASRSAASTTFLPFGRAEWARLVTQNWTFSTIYQVQSGMPFTISVFGDTANSGTVLGENPIRANVTGQPVFGPGTHTADEWFNPAAFATPPAFTYGNVGPKFRLRSGHANPGPRPGSVPFVSRKEPTSSSAPKLSTR